MFGKLQELFSAEQRQARLKAKLDELRQRAPVPVLWLFGKTQSGKTSLIKYLTGAEEAEIGQGFRPCTRFSRTYDFPTPEAPLLTFLDTRGMDEPGYDPAEDLAQFDPKAHVVVVTVKALDHALEHVVEHLRPIRRAHPQRPVLLVPTCLHEAYPQQQHPVPYPFDPPPKAPAASVDGAPHPDGTPAPAVPDALARSLAEQQRRFEGLVDLVVPVDLTRPEDGFAEPNYGGERLKQTLLDVLPAAYRQTLLTLDEASRELQDFYARQALPHIVGYSTLAATAGAIPVPWLDLLILPGIQTQMIAHLARLYGQPLSAPRFLELAGTLGLGMVARQAMREVMKFIPFVGSVAGAALAGASTFALGKAFCFYYSAVHKGHVPKSEDLRRYYQEQLALAEKRWGTKDAPGGPSVGRVNP
ncbi:hypothetical protein AYO44_15460 [Planctomycetaceae bacterium SCGC AG-212-F19]|nr:hypothetical protein AYO44_15460 [Planctomycetaceae bacterium SCGC AG-212-F19]